MTIEYLADHPEAVPTLAEWQHAEWGHTRPGDTAEKRATRLRSFLNRDRIPLTVAAFANAIFTPSIANDPTPRSGEP